MERPGNRRKLSRREGEHCRWDISRRSPGSAEIRYNYTVEVGVDRGRSSGVVFSIGMLKT